MAWCRRVVVVVGVSLLLGGSAVAFAQAHLAYASVSLTVRFGGDQPTRYELDLDFHPAVRTRSCIGMPTGCVGGISTPLFYLYEPDIERQNELVHAEEIRHYQQFRALGLAFHLAYAATLGEPFEPYPIRRPDIIAANLYYPEGRVNLNVYSLERMWMPHANQRPAAPLLRLTGTSRHDAQLSFFPGFTQPLTQIGQELLNATQRASR